jgi:ATP-dependent RNA helicase DDX27
MKQAEMELKKGQNMVEHEAEIFARPARTWFQSEKEKTAAKGESSMPLLADTLQRRASPPTYRVSPVPPRPRPHPKRTH